MNANYCLRTKLQEGMVIIMENNKSKTYVIIGILAAILIAALLFLYLSARDTKGALENVEEVPGETGTDNQVDVFPEHEIGPITAMYVTFGEEGGYVFIGEETASVFTASFPEEIVDVNGNIIKKEQLVNGNVVKIYGNGIMAESYPGQYHGVNKMEVIEQGNPSDTDKYKDIIDSIYQEPDPAEPPMLSIEYRTESAVITAGANRGGYEWTYTDKNGESQSVKTDSAHILQWTEMIDIRLENSTDLTLHFTKEPKEVVVVRWSEEFKGTESEAFPEGEEVTTEVVDNKYMLKAVEAEYIYQVIGTWDNGSVEFGFITVKK